MQYTVLLSVKACKLATTLESVITLLKALKQWLVLNPGKPKIYAMLSLEGSMLSLISLDLNITIFQIWRVLEDCGLAQ